VDRVGDGDGAGAVVVVEDEGPGVPPAVRDDLLLPFVSAASHERDGGGTGIGLSLVDLFAQLHGGEVRVEDLDGGGTRFVVELPAPAA
jgi:signal transduction histidine kinase